MTSNILAAHEARLIYSEYPNGQASVTRSRETSSLVPVEYHQAYEQATEKISAGVKSPGRPTAAYVCSKMPGTLESTKVANCVREIAARGTRGISRSQRRLATSACALLERDHDRKLLSFLTLTQPPAIAASDRSEYAAAKKVFFKWFSRRLEAAGLDPRYIGVTEIQEKRLANHGQFALHEHVAFQGRHAGEGWALTPNEIREAWVRALKIATGKDCTDQETMVCVDLKPVKKSVKSYLGKYISKGSAIVKDLIERGFADQIPATWITRSLAMLHSFRKATVKLYGEQAQKAADILRDFADELVSWSRIITFTGRSGQEIEIGRVYFLKQGVSLAP